MAIGSDPEIGVVFTRWGDMDDEQRVAWFRHMREFMGGDLMGGYGKVCYPDPELRSLYLETQWVWM